MSTKTKKSQNRNTHKKNKARKPKSSTSQRDFAGEFVAAYSAMVSGKSATVMGYFPAECFTREVPEDFVGLMELTYPASQFEKMQRFCFAMNYEPEFDHVSFIDMAPATKEESLRLLRMTSNVDPEDIMTMRFAIYDHSSRHKAAA